MCSDFASVYGKPFVAGMNVIKTPLEYRNLRWPGKDVLPAPMYKRLYQLECLYKRYRFHNDQFSDADLTSITVSKFISTQVRLANHLFPTSATTREVIRVARCHVKRILRSYDPTEHALWCKFGTKSSIGNPLSESYLDRKVPKGGPISGTAEQAAWFKNYADPDIKSWIGENFSTCESLPLVCVPKSYKSLRTIMPNTTLGGFYTSGLGELISRRLKEEGLDIQRLQNHHRRWVSDFSKTKTHVTADLSAASDSFTSSLVGALVPRKWYNALKLGRILLCNYKDPLTGKMCVMRMSSFMTMGIGFTFPLQTLLFYCLLRAIGDLSSLKYGKISVYGDDLIYPTRIHRYVSVIFPKLGFLLNTDKTHVDDNFRESCGSDCYRGVDVRPFQPEGERQELARMPYLSLLYKMANGMLLRWAPEEIPITLRFLHLEMLRCTSEVHIVPMSYPDTAGIKTSDPFVLPFYLPASPVKWDSRLYAWRFRYLTLRPRRRITTSHWIYMWDKLRMGHLQYCSERVMPQLVAKIYSLGVPVKGEAVWSPYDTSADIIEWIKHRDRTRTVKCRAAGMNTRERVLVPTVTMRLSPLQVEHQEGLASNWSEEL